MGQAGSFDSGASKFGLEPERATSGATTHKARRIKTKAAEPLRRLQCGGAAGRIRTHDPLVRSSWRTGKLLIHKGFMPSVPADLTQSCTVFFSEFTQYPPTAINCWQR